MWRFDIPWHTGLTYLCDNYENEESELQRTEQEAFEHAAHILFPSESYFNDAMSLPLSLNAIELIADRYKVSFEAAAIHYIKYNLNPCAIIC